MSNNNNNNTPIQSRRPTQPSFTGPSLSPFPNSLRPSAFKIRPSYLTNNSNLTPREYSQSPVIYQPPPPPSSASSNYSNYNRGIGSSSNQLNRVLPASATFRKSNPFEVLSAPEFDNFVDDVTSRIKRALAGPSVSEQRKEVEYEEENTEQFEEEQLNEEMNDVFGEVKRVEEVKEVIDDVEDEGIYVEDDSMENEMLELEESYESKEDESESESDDDDDEVSAELQR